MKKQSKNLEMKQMNIALKDLEVWLASKKTVRNEAICY